jgi:hypothetical protein
MCWLANYRGEVPSSEEISLVDSIICRELEINEYIERN